MSDFKSYKIILKNLIDSSGYTSEQVSALTKKQIANAISVSESAPFWSDGSDGFYTNLKSSMVQYAKSKEREADEANTETSIGAIIDSAFPDNIREYGADPDSYVKIYYKGKAPVLEEVL